MSELSKKSNFFIFIEILGSLALFAGLSIPMFYFNSLPDNIPIHYNFSGYPDNFGSKLSIWALPLISAFLYAGLHLLQKLIARQKPKPKEDAGHFFRKQPGVLNLLVALKTMLAIIFTYITLATINVALEKWSGLGRVFTPLVLGCTLVLPLAFAIRISMTK
jgi:uncharacterized membrane protein